MTMSYVCLWGAVYSPMHRSLDVDLRAMPLECHAQWNIPHAQARVCDLLGHLQAANLQARLRKRFLQIGINRRLARLMAEDGTRAAWQHPPQLR